LEAENRILRGATESPDAELCLFEKYVGLVTHVGDGQVEVTFNVKNGGFIQVFRDEQFATGMIPKRGDLVTAYCASYLQEPSNPASNEMSETPAATDSDDFPNFKRGITGTLHL
jgi:hypothetical protein